MGSGRKGGRNPKKTPTHARRSEREKQRNEEEKHKKCRNINSPRQL